jgi:probable addiction module antidote protein
MSQLAKDTGLTREALYTSLSESGNPTLTTLLKVTSALGIQLKAVASA